MPSKYLVGKYKVLSIIHELGGGEFDDILHYTRLEPIKIRGLLGYFQFRRDIEKIEKNPSRYVTTEKDLGKLNHWENDKNAKEWQCKEGI